MESKELKELLLRSLTDDISEEEREILDGKVLSITGFDTGFREKLMNRINSGALVINGSREFIRSFDRMFLKIAISGAAAILILTLSILFSQGSLSYDALLGIDAQVDDGLLSLLVE